MALARRRACSAGAGCAQATKEDSDSIRSPVELQQRLPYDLSEEELLEFELADEDLSLCEEEEAEWREYDEEVQQFRELMLQCGADPTSSSSRLALDDASFGALDGEGSPRQEGAEESELGLGEGSLLSEAQVRAFLQSQLADKGGSSAPNGAPQPEEGPGAPPPWVPAAVPLMNGARQLPEEYRERLVEHEGGVVVSDTQGPNALVLISHVPDQPLLLPMVSETFRLQKVKIVRGWLETTDSGAVMDAFEVCDAATDEPLSSERTAALEQALMQAIQAPAARQVMVEIDGQVPQLDCFFGLPAGGSLPVSLAAARGALVDGPFKVSEAREVGRALVFRGELKEGVANLEAMDECARRLRQVLRYRFFRLAI
ncbi:unnamed protein product [Symbiodinium natans]|uniref:Uncharacterized protein n=1 Tax=Symbiodinium natans TaxID=878477 RepID=A0A812QG87_9DINO|nr:unnamed protein product [Symbiodinium natans]